MPRSSFQLRRLRVAFTLIELMASMTILSIILLVVLGILQQTGNAWKRARSNVEAFQGARLAFENITHSLSQATLNTYYDYFDASGHSSQDPSFTGVDHYGRQSDLNFVAGSALVPSQVTQALFFQTPGGYTNTSDYRGMKTLLNACGYYILHGKDPLRPAFLATVPNAPPDAVRYRLMQFLQPSENLQVYGSTTGKDWLTAPMASPSAPVQQLAENIIALVTLPRKSSADATTSGTILSGDYEYDSRAAGPSSSKQSPTQNQLPPLVEVVLVAIDEAAAKRLGADELPILATLFHDSSKLDADIAALEDELIKRHLTYRIFRNTVALRNSKWTS